MRSIQSQSYQNWKCIVIDNHSKDGTNKIAASFAAKDPRFSISSPPQFVSSVENHNFALSLLSDESKYCKFVHADDMILPNCLKEMVAVAESDDKIGLISSYRYDNRSIGQSGMSFNNTSESGRTTGRAVFASTYEPFGNPTSVMMRTDVFKKDGLIFSDQNKHFDTEACFQILTKWDFGFVHKVLTYTERHGESETSRLLSLDTHFLARLVCLFKFGGSFFSESELESIKRDYLSFYYLRLGQRLLKNRSKSLIDYHRKELAKVGLKWSAGRAYLSMIAAGMAKLLDGKRAIYSIMHKKARIENITVN